MQARRLEPRPSLGACPPAAFRPDHGPRCPLVTTGKSAFTTVAVIFLLAIPAAVIGKDLESDAWLLSVIPLGAAAGGFAGAAVGLVGIAYQRWRNTPAPPTKSLTPTLSEVGQVAGGVLACIALLLSLVL